MSNPDALITNYLKHNRKPTFNGFVTKHTESIQEVSVLSNNFDSAAQLQCYWISLYNKNAHIERPTIKLFKMYLLFEVSVVYFTNFLNLRPKKASQNFLLIHKMIKLQVGEHYKLWSMSANANTCPEGVEPQV